MASNFLKRPLHEPATMHPSDVPYVYFVATGTGGHKFSVTLDEHNQAVGQYRATVAKQKETATPETPKADAK